ncbi:winged helix-turn-helix transcriptional regulator [Picrophilus oshimae]|uniref:Transcriptional regulator, AsnC family n=1 Tax=Picrophilus torridus (strain ATCC 700027 / DSM 9790 / JCM 10055 / NBRC 100828 / KAW 2/3) TaxID=1122961 RepID=A0A8G2FXE1_PICTO|nr:winged helix-turn-helix transcriptional regulator [Picrophilus oshimae]SMD31266.1 transcriptional regulator, AsnC family [Picrophilus oshimae DSM 9789]
MDEIDKRIIYYYLKDGRSSQRAISNELKISPQVLKYRFDKMVSSGIIKKFVLHIDPSLQNLSKAFVAVKSRYDLKNIFAEISCLEEISIYGIYGTYDEIIDRIKDIKNKLGNLTMEYIPRINDNINITPNDRLIIDELKKDPRKPASDIANDLNLSYKFVNRRIDYLMKKHLINVIPIIDLSMTDISIFAIFSSRFNELKNIINDISIINVEDQNYGLAVLLSENLLNAKAIIDKCRSVDPNVNVMVVYNYSFYS